MQPLARISPLNNPPPLLHLQSLSHILPLNNSSPPAPLIITHLYFNTVPLITTYYHQPILTSTLSLQKLNPKNKYESTRQLSINILWQDKELNKNNKINSITQPHKSSPQKLSNSPNSQKKPPIKIPLHQQKIDSMLLDFCNKNHPHLLLQMPQAGARKST